MVKLKVPAAEAARVHAQRARGVGGAAMRPATTSAGPVLPRSMQQSGAPAASLPGLGTGSGAYAPPPVAPTPAPPRAPPAPSYGGGGGGGAGAPQRPPPPGAGAHLASLAGSEDDAHLQALPSYAVRGTGMTTAWAQQGGAGRGDGSFPPRPPRGAYVPRGRGARPPRGRYHPGHNPFSSNKDKPPPTYVCHFCSKPGDHYRQNCPSDIKAAEGVGLPRSVQVTVTEDQAKAASDRGAVIINDEDSHKYLQPDSSTFQKVRSCFVCSPMLIYPPPSQKLSSPPPFSTPFVV